MLFSSSQLQVTLDSANTILQDKAIETVSESCSEMSYIAGYWKIQNWHTNLIFNDHQMNDAILTGKP